MKKYSLFLLLFLIISHPIIAQNIGVRCSRGTLYMHPTIMLDAQFYGGSGANDGNYDTSNRYQIRKAALEFTGNLSSRLSYGLEAGIATCQGTSDNVKVMDASIMYAVTENTSIGLKKGHVLRGFAGSTECRERLTLEKPIFFKTFATCHPTGLVLNTYLPFGKIAGLETELAIMNGDGGTLDGEHDYNFGTTFITPISGLSFNVTYNHKEKKYYVPTCSLVSSNGYRMMYGIHYEKFGFTSTAEYYIGKGFTTASHKMEAAYAQMGYRVRASQLPFSYLQPYVMAEYWDKSSNNPDDSEYAFANAGITIGLNETTRIKCNYRWSVDTPHAVPKEPNTFVTRLQIGF